MSKNPVEILLVEDEAVQVEAFRRSFVELEDAFRLTVVVNVRQARDRLGLDPPDVVVANLHLCDGKGTDLLTPMKESLSIPLIVIASAGCERDAVEAIKAGALDYVVKSPENFARMPRIVGRALCEWEDKVTRRKAGQALPAENSKAREYIDTAAAIIMSLDSDCRVTFVNQTGVVFFGWSYEEIVGRDWVGGFVPKGREESVRRAISRVMTGETALPVYVEGWVVTRSGQERLVGWRNALLTGPAGAIAGVLSTGEDVTERKLEEEALRASAGRFRAVFEGAQECIMIKDRSLRYTDVNPAFCKLLGLSASDIVGRRAEDLFGVEIAKQISERSTRVLEGELIESEQTRVVRGMPLTFHDTVFPLKDTKEVIIGICYISRDVTERRRIAADSQVPAHDYPSPSMQRALEKAAVAARNDSTILLQGESGSGKDFLAKWIHKNSLRSPGPFFSINCAALAKQLAESELFGHERGAFTGADRRKKGLLELAEGGTILLNEIGELDLSLQGKLLAFLDTRSFLRVGGEKHVYVNARLIAASHRELMKEMQAKRFLEPLYYRLSVFPLRVPPLRERQQDLPILAEDLIRRLANEMQLTEIPAIDSTVIRNLAGYSWPGNVRELRNVLERSLILWKGGPFHVELPQAEKGADTWSYTVSHDPNKTFHDILEDVAASLCGHALKVCRGNKKQAAMFLQISRETLYRYLRKL
ncbi:MAG: sigma 54-interacting transcriptional regulator [Desulfomonilaceae bacterium]|nr:sigma 54-interacting transcriptional regulator [Desulfomonilaceae bacterium]